MLSPENIFLDELVLILGNEIYELAAVKTNLHLVGRSPYNIFILTKLVAKVLNLFACM